MQNEKLVFRVMVTSEVTLEKEISHYNKFHGTDFKIVKTIYDEVPFCDIEVNRYKISDIFGLGFSLAILEQQLRDKGEIDW